MTFTKLHKFTLAAVLGLAPWTHALAQDGTDYYDDYSSFADDYQELDEESRAIFGKFFQTAFYVGTGLFTGDLGRANTAGVNVGVKFIYFFDRMWAAEIGGFFNMHRSYYDANNTGAANSQLELNTRLIPVVGSLRFSFDTENMPRGLAQMNPYLSAGAALVFRQESVVGTPNTTPWNNTTVTNRYQEGAIFGSTNFGINFGGGAEFDVYKNRVFAGLDIRYYMMFWSDAQVLMKNLGRQGSYISILGSISYAY
ncbi:MAG TPA: hypothetical protein VM901_01805 [Bdellovibrionota bacterium]|nr:hypothetical protein [Bdellovibrionota bacterium]